MGVGKTTVGEILSERLGIPFLDADREIELAHRMPVTEIFRTMGEPAFRQMEKELIVGLCSRQDPIILSLGGGAFLQEEIRESCLANALVFHLELSWNAWIERMASLVGTRPVLQGKSIGEIEELFRKRLAAYALSHWTVPTDQASPQEVADRILGILMSR
ncbi:shikimate kinase [Cohnella caldifontis]|uniref:shikimate kinase n=1 Tax=Cohnella caldifontis TaxID=3027471 RepID=UPI0023EDE787|nr:shikimate kinase [Cohnella sp. YIM B05605]